MDRETTQKRDALIRRLLDEGYSVPDLSSIYGLSTQSIWRIKYAVDKSIKNGLDNIPEKEYAYKQDNK